MLAGALASMAPASAGEGEILFTVRPARPGATPETAAWIIRTAEADTTLDEAVFVENLGDVPVDLILYPADANTGPDGGFTVEPEEGEDDGVSAWVTLEHDRASLEPGERLRVPLHIDIPPNASPGDHPGGIVARTARPVEGGPFPANLAVAARLYLTVDGPQVYDLRINDVRAENREDGMHFFLEMQNAGNMILDVGGVYAVRAPFGLGDDEAAIDTPATLVPGAVATKEIVWPGEAVLGGRHTATFALTYNGDRTAQAQVSFFLTPPPLVLAIAGLIALAIMALVAAPIVRRRMAA